MWRYSSSTSRSWWITQSTQHQRRGCNSTLALAVRKNQFILSWHSLTMKSDFSWLSLLSKHLLIMELHFDAMFYSNLGNENSDTDHIKRSRGPQVPHPWYKPTWLTAISSHCLTTLPARMSAFNSYMRQNAYYITWSASSKISCQVIVTQQRLKNSLTSFATCLSRQRSGFSELQAHNCMLTKQWTWLLSSMSVISANKLSLQEFTQLIRIKLLISRFPENVPS